MSIWDETVLADEANAEFLADCDDLDGGDLVDALRDACILASDAGTGGRPVGEQAGNDADYANGLCAATVASIWAGAPFTAASVADEFAFIRAGIGECPERLQDAALQVLDAELEAAGDDAPDGLETAVEALS